MPQDTHLAFLRAHHADEMGHTYCSLLDHLTGTHDLLEAWGEDADVAAAGLFHSVYGTESYKASAVPLDLRPQVRAVIGERAEALAYLFGAMEKATLSESVFRGSDFAITDRHTGDVHRPDEAMFRDLCAVVVANWLEQYPRLLEKYPNWKADLFGAMRAYVSPAATEALSGFYEF